MNFLLGMICTLIAVGVLLVIVLLFSGGAHKELGTLDILEAGLMLADVLLAAIGILLALVSIGLAVWGAFSFTRVKIFIENQIKNAVNQRLSDYIKTHDIKGQVEATVQKRVKEEGDNVYLDLQLTQKGKQRSDENV